MIVSLVDTVYWRSGLLDKTQACIAVKPAGRSRPADFYYP